MYFKLLNCFYYIICIFANVRSKHDFLKNKRFQLYPLLHNEVKLNKIKFNSPSNKRNRFIYTLSRLAATRPDNLLSLSKIYSFVYKWSRICIASSDFLLRSVTDEASAILTLEFRVCGSSLLKSPDSDPSCSCKYLRAIKNQN